jgi:divalent metal cation (Fe/Co/Zn/Cd) transporter
MTKPRFNASLVHFLGTIAIIMAGFFLVLYNIRVFKGEVPRPDIPLAAGTLAFVGVLGVVISRCLKNLETRLPSSHTNGESKPKDES